MAETSANATEWYLAREGQQFGPISVIEMRKLIELGHLRDTDLVWRAGLSEWHPAAFALQELAAPAQAPAPTPMPGNAPSASAGIQGQAGRQPAEREPRSHPQPTQEPVQPTQTAPDPEPVVTRPARDDRQGSFGQAGPSGRDMSAPASGASPIRENSADPDPFRGDPGRSDPGRSDPGRSDPGRGQPDRAPRQDYQEATLQARDDTALSTRDYDYDDEDDEYEDGEDERGAAYYALRAIAAVLILALLGGGIWYGYTNRAAVMQLVGLDGSGDASSPPTLRSDDRTVATLAPSATAPQETSSTNRRIGLVTTGMWQTISAGFPAWSERQQKDAFDMQRSGTEIIDIERVLLGRIAKLRRENAKQALSAPAATLRSIAEAFLKNLRVLAAQDVRVCHSFIRSGEAHPLVLEYVDDAKVMEPVHTQIQLIFKAISEGARDPTTHDAPLQRDYRDISVKLKDLGWTSREMTLFSDPQKLSAATPDTVCKLVTDWFTAQLALEDQDAQIRLLVQSLRPVVAG